MRKKTVEHNRPSLTTGFGDKSRLKVLILEDCVVDAELLVRELQRTGFDVTWNRVDQKAAYIQALADSYDLVLADYSLPQFDGLEALELLRERNLQTPFLLISGTVGEEIAVQAIKRGAQDYLLKDRLARLGPAVVQAMESNVLQQQAEQGERQRNQLLQKLENRVNESTVLQEVLNVVTDDDKSDDEVFQFIVDQIPAGWRYPKQVAARLEVDGREFYSPDYSSAGQKLLVRFAGRCGRSGVLEVAYLPQQSPDGDEFHQPSKRKLLSTLSGVLSGFVDRRYSSQTLLQAALVLANVHDAAIVTDTEGVITFWNEGATRLFGWTASEMLGRHYADRFSEEMRPWIREQLQERLSGNDWIGEYQDWRKDGSRIWIDSHVTRVIDGNGRVIGIIGVSRDITVRKIAEVELQKSETRYRNLVESSHDLIWSVNTEGIITYMNQASRWIYGRDPSEMIGRSFSEFVPPEQFEKDARLFEQAMQTGCGTLDYQSRVYRKDGSVVSLSANATILRDEKGNITGASGISRDMSELYEANIALRKRETLLANAERIAEMGSWDYDISRDRLDWSPNTLRIFGLEEGEFAGTSAAFLERVHPDDRDRLIQAQRQADAGARLLAIEYRILRGSGEERVIRERGEVTFDHSGMPVRRSGVLLDITEDVRNLEALRKSEERFNLAVEGSAAGLWDWDVRENTVFYSDRFKELLGYAKHEFPPRLESFYDSLHPEDRDRVDTALDEHFYGDAPYDIAYRLRTSTGKYRWFQARGAVLRDEAGQPCRMAGSLVDINSQKMLERDLIERERKQRELVEQLREEKRRLAEAQNVAKVGSWETDIRTMKVVWSDEAHRIFGTSPATFNPTHEKFLEFVHPDEREYVAEAFTNSLDQNGVNRIEHRIVLGGGRVKFIEETWRSFHDDQGVPVRAVGTCRDITTSKRAEADLAAHARRFQVISLITRSLLEIRDLTVALNTCTDEIHRHLDGAVTRVWLMCNSTHAMQLVTSAGELPVEIEERVLASSERLVASAVNQRRSVFLDNPSPSSESQVVISGTRSHGAIPLVEGDKCLGVLEVFCDSRLGDDERTGLEIIASSLALSIDRIRSEDEVRTLNAQLGQRVDERTKELSESYRRHDTLLSNLQGMAYRCRRNDGWAMEYVSNGCRELLGVEPADLIGGTLESTDLIHPDDRSLVADSCRAGIAKGSPIQHEYRVIQPGGCVRWVWEQARGIYDSNGEVEALEGFITDITATKLAALREKNQNQLYELLTSGASLSACLEQIVKSAESENPSLSCFILLLDDASTRLSIAAGGNLAGDLREWLDELPVRVDGDRIMVRTGEYSPEQTELSSIEISSAIRGLAGLSGRLSHYSVPIRSIDGSAILGTFNACSLHAGDLGEQDLERIDWAANLANLAIQHVRAKQALVESVSFTQTTLDAISAHIAVLDSSGRIITTNRAWRQFAIENGGTEEECCSGANYLKVCQTSNDEVNSDSLKVETALKAILNGEQREWKTEYPCHSPTERRWFSFHARGFKIHEEQHCLVAHENITAMKRTEEQLRHSVDAAEQASLAKSQFLATMSHELRTPLNGILGMNQLLLASDLDEQQRRYAEASNSSGRLLLNLINDILDLSKIEAGKLELDVRECNLQELIRHACDTMSHTAEQQGLYLECELGPELSLTVLCDEHRVRQILVNLVGNAIKFTAEGGVTVKARLIQLEGGIHGVRLDVADTGIGIPADRMNLLFGRFSQIDSSNSRNFGGSGLGLSICKELTELMGGSIGVESEVGRGSVFWFEIPVMIIESSKAERTANVVEGGMNAPQLSGHVLVAEDNRINQLYITELLRNLGCTYSVAENGMQAVELASRESFDIILMDCQMPEVDGFAATREIRNRKIGKKTGGRLPIVALTANALKGDRERCLSAGMDDYLSKPIEWDKLRETLNRFLG